jgi:arylsulfatase
LSQALHANGAGGRARAAAAAVTAAVLTGLLFDVAFSIARGTALNLGYLGLCGSLMLAAGAACIAVAALLPGTGLRVALVLYVIAHGVTDPETTWLRVAGALAMGGVTWMFVAPNRLAPGRVPAIDSGAIVGAALCFTLVLWPYARSVLHLPWLLPWQDVWLDALVFGLVLMCVQLYESVRDRAPVLISSALVSCIALALTIGAAAFTFDRLRPQSKVVSNEDVAAPRAPLPDVFVLVLDTVRADHLASYGYERDTTPNLRRFLADHPEAIQYQLALSPASWTVPAHASLLTGLMPSAHHARSGENGHNLLASATESLAIVADETLAEVLHRAGYCTSAVVANAYLLRVDGLQRGFELFIQPYPSRPLRLIGHALRRRFAPGLFAGSIKPYPSARSINRDVVRVHGECGSRPSFVLANYMEAHSPYLAPPPHAGLFADDRQPTISLNDAVLSDPEELVSLKRDRYDESLHHLDANLGELFAAMEASGLMRRSWVFITSDHGESFREHKTTSHGSSIYNEQVRIPLIVKPPHGIHLPPTQEPVSLLDVTTTVAAIAGRDGFGVGHDLRRPSSPERAVAIEFRGSSRTDTERYGATAADPARAVVIGHLKLLERGGRYELYDLAEDPRELADRSSSDPIRVHTLAAALPANAGAVADRKSGNPPGSLRPDEFEDLRALGYAR